MEAQFARVQPQITIFASAIRYECMSIEIKELLGVMMMTTSNKGFLMNKMSFVHLFKMVMIFNFHIGGIFSKGNNGGWIIHLEKKDDFCFNYWDNNWGESNQEFKTKMDLPSFNDQLHIEDFLNWVHTVENFFRLFEYFRRKSSEAHGI